MADYSSDDLRIALSDLPLDRGDILFSHSNLGFFGHAQGVRNADALCRLFAEAVLDRIGYEGTLVVPTFTYSFPRGEVFDPEASPSGMGLFAEWVRRHSDARRSVDPCYSVAAIGGKAEALTAEVPENSFGPGSFFDRFYEAGGKILNFNFGAGSTFVHYVERQLKVPYRFDKTFIGRIRRNGEEHAARSTIWVRYLSDDALINAPDPLDRLARAEGLFHPRRLGRGELGLITAADLRDLVARTLPLRPWFLTRAEGMGVTRPRIVAEPCIVAEQGGQSL
ncbi:AAC(3) family N-acetyltransferase [Candidatus Thiosymbion oneisti]|uniref:AAC(3) family N-acetyltransferase n=1 Tax=Candidatus Thiosymbion oneisti TaxID=589554 RepID=UPI000A855FC1|nr:AAC(3) family N-acetyltransferase [Candidatus Thiosymbion oneisti]